MAISATVISTIAKEIVKSATKSKWKELQRDYRVFKILKPLNLVKLENDPKSIYAHALVDYGTDKEPAELVLLFAQPSVRRAIEKDESKLEQVITEHLHTNKDLMNLKPHFPSYDSLLEEIDDFQLIFNGFQRQAADPFFLKQFNQMREGIEKMAEGIDKLLEENRLNSFEYQIEQYLENQIKEFKEKYINTGHYVDLNGVYHRKQSFGYHPKDIENNPNIRPPYFWVEVQQFKYSPIDKLINEWVRGKRRKFLVILGEYGTGKTTFSKYLSYQLAFHHLKGKTVNVNIKDSKYRIPVYLPLRDFEKTMDAFIHNQCKKYGIENLNYAEFKKRIANDELIIILDGFDEMTTKASLERKKSNFLIIKTLFESSPNCKFILTCREEFFQSKDDITKVFGDESYMEFAHLLTFDDNQIQQFLKSHTKKNAAK